jgi:hypothetical protein
MASRRFPSWDKRPAIRGYNRVGLRGSRELACKFADATALGFMTNERTRITGLDIDTQTTMTRRRRQPHAFIAALVCVTRPLMVAEIALFRFLCGFLTHLKIKIASRATHLACGSK